MREDLSFSVAFWCACTLVLVLLVLLGCTERVVDAEGAEREIDREDIRARIPEVLGQRDEDVAGTCSCSYQGLCHGCGVRMTTEGIKHGCGWGLQKCSGLQSCERVERVIVTRDRITLKTGAVVFSYPKQSREVISKRITGSCE